MICSSAEIADIAEFADSDVVAELADIAESAEIADFAESRLYKSEPFWRRSPFSLEPWSYSVSLFYTNLWQTVTLPDGLWPGQCDSLIRTDLFNFSVTAMNELVCVVLVFRASAVVAPFYLVAIRIVCIRATHSPSINSTNERKVRA